MTRSLRPFIFAVLCQFVAAFLVVMSTAFVTIPYVVGGHPGEARLALAAAAWHLS